MKTIISCRARALIGLAVIFLVACTGAQIGLNELKAVNPTEPFRTLEASPGSASDVDSVVNRLVRNYQQYGALYAAIEKERPTAENTCYELAEKVTRIKPLLKEQESVLVGSEKLYAELAALKADDQGLRSAAESGNVHAAKARERVRKYDELADITNSFTADCPTEGEMFMHIMTGITAIGALEQYDRAKEKAPKFNLAVRQLEELSAQEKALASSVVQSLNALRPGSGGASSGAGR